jgi:hypothetical protein
MNYRALAPVAIAAIIAFAQPVAFIAQEAGKAAEILAAARKAIGDKKLDALKTFSVQSSLQRNVQNVQINSDVEIVLDLPDKYLRSETSSGGGMMIMSGGGTSGFNGDRALQKLNGGGMASGGGMVIRMGGPGGPLPGGNAEKPTPDQLEQMNKAMVRNSQGEASRLMLGWFAMAHPSVNATYTYAGDAESPDGKAYVIDIKAADNFAARLFIDEQTHLPLMVTYKAPQPRMMTAGGPRPAPAAGGDPHVMTSTAARAMTEEERKKATADAEKQLQEMQRQPQVLADYTLFFEDWRDADGVKFPHKMRRAMGADTMEEWTVSKVKVNPKVDPKRFAGES